MTKDRRNRAWYGKLDKDGFIHRSWMKNQGFPDHAFDGRPVIGICNTWSELTPCNSNLRDLAEGVKRGVWEAGGFPVEFPVMSLGETQMKPTAMLFRNLLAMETEELIRSHPVDGVVLMGCCDKTTPGLTLESVWEDLQTRAEKGPVFIKDFPHYINHLWDPDFLAHLTHAFLIRDPAKTLTSMYNKWPDFHEKEVGFPEQRELFDRVADDLGAAPPVIDSDDMLEDPVTLVRAWCEGVGIDFMESALSWQPGPRDEVSWWDGGSFHANLRNSDGLKPQSRSSYIDIEAAPDRVKIVYEKMLPHYEHLYCYRIKMADA